MLQLCLPTRLLSTCVHGLARSRIGWLKGRLIHAFCSIYRVDLSEAANPEPGAYPSFNAFFTRALRPGARPLTGGPDSVTSPVDGQLGAFGVIRSTRLVQTKGMAYELPALLAGHMNWARQFDGGRFATLYLAPHNYHRVHMPLDGVLQDCAYVPGRLFGVNPASVRSIPRLFTRNERLIAVFETAAGPMAMIMVGAFCVGGIETRWAGAVCPPHRRGAVRPLNPTPGADAFRSARGEEMGRFNLGSSVILLFGRDAVEWDADLAAGQPLLLGRSIGRRTGG